MANLFGRSGRIEGVNAKSTAMSPILWLIAVIFTGTSSLYFATRQIAVVYIGLVLIFLILLYAMRCYEFFMKNDPDRLQSERFSIKKMELQQGIIGDQTKGFIHKTVSETETEMIEIPLEGSKDGK